MGHKSILSNYPVFLNPVTPKRPFGLGLFAVGNEVVLRANLVDPARLDYAIAHLAASIAIGYPQASPPQSLNLW
jgi:hypothetical protein